VIQFILFVLLFILQISPQQTDCDISFCTEENQSRKCISSCLMPVNLYHPNSYCNMLPPYLTTFNGQSSLKIPVVAFPVHTKHKVCTVFKGPQSNANQDSPYVSHTSTSILSSQTCLRPISVDVLSNKCDM